MGWKSMHDFPKNIQCDRMTRSLAQNLAIYDKEKCQSRFNFCQIQNKQSKFCPSLLLSCQNGEILPNLFTLKTSQLYRKSQNLGLGQAKTSQGYKKHLLASRQRFYYFRSSKLKINSLKIRLHFGHGQSDQIWGNFAPLVKIKSLWQFNEAKFCT